MEKYGHLITGGIMGILLIVITHFTLGWYILDVKNVILCLSIMGIFPLLPDIDIKSGTIVWVFIPVSIIGFIASRVLDSTPIFYMSLGLLTATYICAQFLGHRGLTHSLLFDIIICIPVTIFLGYQFAVLAFVCYYSHLAADKLFFKLI